MIMSGAAFSRTSHFCPSAVFLRSTCPTERRIPGLSRKTTWRRYSWIAVERSLNRSQNLSASSAIKAFVNPPVSQLLHAKKCHPAANWVQCLSNLSTMVNSTRMREHSEDASAQAKKDNANKDEFGTSQQFQIKLSEIERMYPLSKAKLKEVYSTVESHSELKSPLIEKSHFNKKKGVWMCDYIVKWPEERTISGSGHTKVIATKQAALKCLTWLHNVGKMRNGKPTIHSKAEILTVLNKPITLEISSENVENMRAVVNKYHQGINALVEDPSDETIRSVKSMNSEMSYDLISSSSAESLEPKNIAARNASLKNRHEKRSSHRHNERLPIANYREMIIEEIERNQVVLIKGDTGCGKTTQVPQYVMEHFEMKGRGTDCNMIVSQPRRISAISLAERIAEERDEMVGNVVGYQVRLDQRLPQAPGAILFCTTGVLLKKLLQNPTLEGCSHVILDEAHERSINTDMLLVLLKSAIEANPKLKLVIMSATLNADLFQRYLNCQAIEVPGKLYPVEMNFLDDMQDIGVTMYDYVSEKEFMDRAVVDFDSVARLISWIDANKPKGAILTFLPGWGEIMNVKKRLQESDSHHRLHVVTAHSKMSHADQKKIFHRAPEGKRKVVLATDIAETGITVADVVYVVDSGTRKALRWDEKRGISIMQNQYASQANIVQRKGRAGRVQPGTSYHMITRDHFDYLDPHPLPEIMCAPLEKTILDCKTYSNEEVSTFLSNMPQAPTKSAIKTALRNLVELGALDDQEDLTPLGKRISSLTVHPKLAKTLVYSTIFQCVAPVVTIATAMSSESDIFSGGIYNKEAKRKTKAQYNPHSDHISISWIFYHWLEYALNGIEHSKAFCQKLQIAPYRIFMLSKIRSIHAQDLVDCRMLNRFEDYEDLDSTFNEYFETDELVCGMLLAGSNQLLLRRDFEIRDDRIQKGKQSFVTEDKLRATITPESVNYKQKGGISPFLTYFSKQHSEERRTCLVHDTSMIAPITALLFSEGNAYYKADNSENSEDSKNVTLYVSSKKNLRISCDKEVAMTILQFRETMWSVVRYLVERQGLVENSSDSDFRKVQNFKEFMLQVIVRTLLEASPANDENSQAEKENANISDDD